MLRTERGEYRTIQFEETELRLGLPCSDHHHHNIGDQVVKTTTSSKRGFCETETNNGDAVDLKLNLSTMTDTSAEQTDRKINEKVVSGGGAVGGGGAGGAAATGGGGAGGGGGGVGSDPSKPPAKAQVVGWPPVRSFRKNVATIQKKTAEEKVDQKTTNGANGAASSGAFVKVSMDGAPYLRKVDLKLYKSYQELSNALAIMFSSFTIGECGTHGTKDFMNESKLIDLLNGSDYVATYEDKDGDWMLVGDVPWEMFVGSCKRLCIMKGSEAIGLAPRAVEKCKNRS